MDEQKKQALHQRIAVVVGTYTKVELLAGLAVLTEGAAKETGCDLDELECMELVEGLLANVRRERIRHDVGKN